MKKKLELGPLMEHFPVDIRDSVFHQAKEEGQDADKLFLQRRGHSEKAKTNQLDEGSRAAIKYVSTRTMDRDNEIIVPSGIQTKEFMKYGHVLWGHNYSLPPLGSDEWIKADDYGLLAKTIYADTGDGTMANVLWNLVQQGHQKASSIGFVPLTFTQPGHNDFDRVVGKLESTWPELSKTKDKIRSIYTKVILLEHSDVAVPANVNSEIVEVAKGFGASDEILTVLGLSEVDTKQAPEGFADWNAFVEVTEDFPNEKPYPDEHSARLIDPDKYDKFRRQNDKLGTGIHAIFGIAEDGKAELQAIKFDKAEFTVAQAGKWMAEHDYKPIKFESASGKGERVVLKGSIKDEEEKAVIPYKQTPKAPASAPWNGPKEVAAADVNNLKIMCAWYDKENEDLKSAYKLPHHRAGGDYLLVWRGVSAAMGALLGARGGVAIPTGDKKDVYAHLTKHYVEFDKEPPELREYVQGDLKNMFPELYDIPGERKNEGGLTRSVRVVRRCVRVVEEAKAATVQEVATKQVKEALNRIRGKV